MLSLVDPIDELEHGDSIRFCEFALLDDAFEEFTALSELEREVILRP